ncbi:MAG TPA: RDD family protein [Actinomycetes bacterium]|nr:RDD family protein [Actinomycetes bacterium]
MTYEGAAPGRGLITGDAVVVELRYAKLPSRSVAFGIDLAIEIAALIGMTLLVGAVANVTDSVLALVLFFVVTIGVFVGYPVTCETLTRGRTVGKLAMGLRVVRDDGGAIRFRHALVRGLLAVVEVYLFLAVSVITSLVSPEGKRVGDYLAGTVVVRERAPKSSTYAPWVHPQLQGWASTLDLSRLQPSTAMASRQFLTRAASLSPEPRRQLGLTLSAEVAAQVSPAPPFDVPPETYLAAVLAERARRADASAVPPAAPRAAPPTASPPPAPSTPEPSTSEDAEPGGGFAAPS